MTRRALVIGCGGTIGGAWIVAALSALCREIGLTPADFDILQGTSAGAEMVTMLAGGVTPEDLVAMQRGEATDPRLRAHLAATPAGLPPMPRPRLMNPRLLRAQTGLAALTGIAPTGRGDSTWLQRLADGFTDGAWLPHPGARMVAFDVDRGDRVAFGAPGAPVASAGAARRLQRRTSRPHRRRDLRQLCPSAPLTPVPHHAALHAVAFDRRPTTRPTPMAPRRCVRVVELTEFAVGRDRLG